MKVHTRRRSWLRSSAGCLVFGLAVSLAGAGPAGADPAAGGDEKVNATAIESGHHYRRFIIGYQPAAAEARSDRAASAAAGRQRLHLVRRLATGGVLVEVPSSVDSAAAVELMRGLAARPEVAYVEPDSVARPTSTPDDPLYPRQWHYSEAAAGANLPGAWDVADGSGVTVAVVDSGITAHSDLDANVTGGYDFISEPDRARDGDGRDADPGDEGDWQSAEDECFAGSKAQSSTWHGTHVAGTIAAVSGNGVGVAGVAPEATVVPVRVLGHCGGLVSDIADGVVWAAGGSVPGVPDNPNPAEVINVSIGGPGSCGPTYQNAIDSARDHGATVVVSAGNDNADASTVQPAACAGVITVAATDREGNRAVFNDTQESNYGDAVEVAAPGGETTVTSEDGILSTSNTGATTPGGEIYRYLTGTSQAAPHVAGLAALMLSRADLTPDQVSQLIQDNARPLPGKCDLGCGTGLIDAAATVEAVDAGPPGGSQDLAVRAVTASGSDDNGPANTRDGDFGTRWSAEGDGEWIRYDLGDSHQLDHVDVAWYRGTERTASYDLQVSPDGSSWQTVTSGESSGDTTDFESYDVAGAEGRYVRIVGHGNSDNEWNSITEVKVFGDGPADPGSGSGALPVAAVDASEQDGDNGPANTRDGDLGTRWSAEAIDRSEWISYDLGAATSVHLLKVAWYRGDERRTDYRVEVSADGASWTTVTSGESSGSTTGLETYDFADATGRYVRIVGDGNSDNDWVSITEVEIYGAGGEPPDDPPDDPPPGDTAPNGVRQLYQANTSGAEPWTLGHDDWRSRFDPDGGEITGDGDGTVITADDQIRMHVDAIPDNDCDGITDHQRALEQGYMCTQDDWTNWEMTGYIRVTDPASDLDGDGDWTWYGNGGTHPRDGDPCTGSAYKGSYHYKDAQVRFGKESYHMAYDYRSWHDVDGGIDYTEHQDQWLGMKVVRYEFTRGGERGVRLELWLDLAGIDAGGNPANDWTLALVEEDHPDQEPWGEDATDCNAPSDTQPMLWGGPYVVYRWDNTESQIRLMTVREIVPPAGARS